MAGPGQHARAVRTVCAQTQGSADVAEAAGVGERQSRGPRRAIIVEAGGRVPRPVLDGRVEGNRLSDDAPAASVRSSLRAKDW